MTAAPADGPSGALREMAAPLGAAAATRVALGPGAPAPLAEFIGRAGLEVLPYTQRHGAALYVDFVGARPSAAEVLSIDLSRGGGRAAADLIVEDWQAAACFIVSTALKLRPPLLTTDSTMLAAIRAAVGVGASPVPVILQGEIGAGKYNLARLRHAASRTRAPLLTLNCARFEELDSSGLLTAISRQAEGAGEPGAPPAMLYLDEIGELSDAAQLKLLELLQSADRLFWSGGGAARRGTLCFTAATNRALETLVEQGDFRRELYWRLKVFALEIPPLRQRGGDVPLLARYLLRRANPRRALSPAALKIMTGYAFPGNVLELENLVTRLAIAPLVGPGGLIEAVDIRQHLMTAATPREGAVSGWKSSREEARREMILRTIAAAGGNRLEAARRLGITLRALQYHITRAGLSRRRAPRAAQLVTPLDIADAAPPLWGTRDGV